MGMHHDSGRDAAWRDRCADLDAHASQGFGFEEDRRGLNPRRKKRRDTTEDWRDRRLAGAVRRAVQMGLADCGDPLLQALVVERVAPGPRGTRGVLRVEVSAAGATEDAAALIPARLAAVAARLRAEVARAVHRKRTPNLVFAVVPPGGMAGEEGGDEV